AEVAELRERLRSVKHTVLVLSGKGGVGKSTFSALLAHGLAADEAKQVALLDIDICGPSIPKMMGLEGEQASESSNMLFKGFVLNFNVYRFVDLKDSLLGNFIVKSGFKTDLRSGGRTVVPVLLLLIESLLEHITQAYVPQNMKRAVIIHLSLQDVRKEINFCHKVKLPIIGVVENMSGFVCPKCKNESQIFPPTTGGAEKMCQKLNVSLLGKVPLDPQIGKSCDKGQSFLSEAPESPATSSYRHIIQRIQEYCDQQHFQEEKII
ncbi:NUBP1 factor, partial [Corythaeola cristata]|nr:NUBP1 factor [Corythaeola cristata]